MNTYRRNINFRIMVLWSISVTLVIASLLLSFTEMYLAAFMTFGLFVVSAFITINRLLILGNTITIHRYSAFGFKKHELVISGKHLGSIKLWEHGKLDHTTSTDSFLDLLFIPALFLEGKKGMTFKSDTTEANSIVLRLYLSNEEYLMIQELLQQQNSKAYNISFMQ